MKKDKLIKNNKDNFNGFTLLGTLFSAFFAIIVIAAIVSLTAQIYNSSRSSKNRFIAVGLAKEGIELVRSMRDSNWLFYQYDSTSGVSLPTTQMKWRGDTSGSCSANTSCLRSLCNGTYRVDALTPSGSNFELVSAATTDRTKLKTNGNGFYTYTSGDDTIFSRLITISGAGACGEVADSNVVSTKPNPMVVTSTVYWKDSTSDRTTVLQEALYDWMLQRP